MLPAVLRLTHADERNVVTSGLEAQLGVPNFQIFVLRTDEHDHSGFRHWIRESVCTGCMNLQGTTLSKCC